MSTVYKKIGDLEEISTPSSGDFGLLYRNGRTYKTPINSTPVNNPPASNVGVTPVGNVSATNVQAAIQELDSEKSAVGHTHSQTDVTGLVTALSGKSDVGHTHTSANITDFAAQMATKANASHTHAQAEVTGLVTALAGKANSAHSHAQSDITNLVTDLAGKANVSHTHAQSEVTGLVAALANKTDVGHTHTTSNITGLDTALANLAGQVPAGIIELYAGSSAPAGWLLCAGQAVSRTTFSALFAVLGTTFGAGDGSTTFNVPDLRGRVGVGLDNMGGTDAGRLSVANTLGLGFGTETVAGNTGSYTLTASDIPSHVHNQNAGTAGGATNGPYVLSQTGFYTAVATTQNTGSTGTGGGHSHTMSTTVLQPSLLLNYVIKT